MDCYNTMQYFKPHGRAALVLLTRVQCIHTRYTTYIIVIAWSVLHICQTAVYIAGFSM